MVNDTDMKIVAKAKPSWEKFYTLPIGQIRPSKPMNTYNAGFLAGYKQAMSDIIQYLDTKNEG